MDCYIDKETGTYAETLEAVGLASAIRELGFRGVRVKGQGYPLPYSLGAGLCCP